MKLFNRFLLVLLVLALSLSALTACQLASGDETTAAPEYKTITIAEALELCGESGNITTERIAL